MEMEAARAAAREFPTLSEAQPASRHRMRFAMPPSITRSGRA